MPKKIDQKERKEKILHTALAVFAKEGYQNSNLSLIADECGLSRPTLYRYFTDKEEIYYYAVKLVTGSMFKELSDIGWASGSGTALDRLKDVCYRIIQLSVDNEDTLRSLMDVMLHNKRFNIDFSTVIMKRTAKLTILLKRLILRGIQEGIIKSSCDVKKASSYIFTILEAFCFQIAFFGGFDIEQARDFIDTYLDSIKA